MRIRFLKVFLFRRSSTQGKGEFSMEYSRYSPCLPEVQEKLVMEYQRSIGLIKEDSKDKEKEKKQRKN